MLSSFMIMVIFLGWEVLGFGSGVSLESVSLHMASPENAFFSIMGSFTLH